MATLLETMESAITDPPALERLYRKNTKEFPSILLTLCEKYPDSPILHTWHERLFFQEDHAENPEGLKEIPLLIALCIVAGTFMKLPDFFPSLLATFYTRSIFFSFIPAIFIFFSYKEHLAKTIFGGSLVFFTGSYLMLWFLPDNSLFQSNFLAYSHISLLLWSFVALYFVKDDIGKNWRGKLAFFSFTVEMMVVTGLILICGILLTILTIALFSFLNMDIVQWYTHNVVVYGAVSSPIVATWILLRNKIDLRTFITTLARIFSPIALLTLIIYCIAFATTSTTLFVEREDLLLFNVMLVCVLALSVFNIADREKSKRFHWSDISTFGLIAIALLINGFALSSILYRLVTWGFTPNKFVILGMNFLILLHLIGISLEYIFFLFNKKPFTAIEQFTAQYLPVYTAWSAVVVFVVPVLFGFQ